MTLVGCHLIFGLRIHRPAKYNHQSFRENYECRMHVLEFDWLDHMASRSNPCKFVCDFVVNTADTPESDANTVFALVVVHSRVEFLEKIEVLRSPSRRVAPSLSLLGHIRIGTTGKKNKGCLPSSWEPTRSFPIRHTPSRT